MLSMVHRSPEQSDIFEAVKFLRANDDWARSIGLNSQAFAHTHLTSPGRDCYLKKLFEEMRKLQTYDAKLSGE